MTEEEKIAKEKRTAIVSRVEGTTLLEFVVDAAGTNSALALAEGGDVRVVSEWRTARGELLVPLRPDHGLVRHGVVLLSEQPLPYGSRAALLADIEHYLT
jgi:hypothetical protein